MILSACSLKSASWIPKRAMVSIMLPDCHHKSFLVEIRVGHCEEWTATYHNPVSELYHLSCRVLIAEKASSAKSAYVGVQ